MAAEKCPECGTWWAWPGEHRCSPVTSATTTNLTVITTPEDA